jgi:hypothetical protein
MEQEEGFERINNYNHLFDKITVYQRSPYSNLQQIDEEEINILEKEFHVEKPEIKKTYIDQTISRKNNDDEVKKEILENKKGLSFSKI